MNLSNQNNQTKPANAGTPNGKHGADKHAVHAGQTTGKADADGQSSPTTSKAGTPANNFQKNGPGGAPPAGKNGDGDSRKSGSPSSAAEATQTNAAKSGATPAGNKPADPKASSQGQQGQQAKNQPTKHSGEVAQPAKGGREADADAKSDAKSDPKADATTTPKVAGAQPEVQAMDNESPAAARSAKADKKSEIDQKKDGTKVLAPGGNGVSETEGADDETQMNSNSKGSTSGDDDEDADTQASHNGRATDKKNQPKVEVPQKKQGQNAGGQGSSQRK